MHAVSKTGIPQPLQGGYNALSCASHSLVPTRFGEPTKSCKKSKVAWLRWCSVTAGQLLIQLRITGSFAAYEPQAAHSMLAKLHDGFCQVVQAV